jgi:CheY-like chemotaxis protein
MASSHKPITILMADDDDDDRELTRSALARSRLANDLRFVVDGEELMDYLRRRGKYADEAQSPRPGLILLDLNMPRKDGREALAEIKSDPNLRSIPVLVLTTSDMEKDIAQSYALGANSYISKPVTFEGLVEVIRVIGVYWFDIVALPERQGS